MKPMPTTKKPDRLPGRAVHASGEQAPPDDVGQNRMPPERMIPVLHALTDGLTFLRFLPPELITDEVVVPAFEALAPGRHASESSSS
jgi:hypothetical protein